jgi:hypothetical protein
MFLGNLIDFPAIVVLTSPGANNLPLAVQVLPPALPQTSPIRAVVLYSFPSR